MLVAARKHFHTNEELAADLDESTGAILIYGVKKVVAEVADPDKEISLEDARKIRADAEIDSEIRFPKPTDALGRISAQTAKQVILQKVREAERDNVFSEYAGRIGELVRSEVKRIEGPDLIVGMGKTEARLLKKEQSKLESFSVGDRIACVIKSVDKTGKNAGVIISRAAPELVMRLFEQEVPEIYDNTVVIKGCAREAGERTKIAVSSRDRDVDSVGACVGMKGMRVQSIIRELRGEKIDIIEYNDDPVVFATHALSPAKIARVTIVDAARQAHGSGGGRYAALARHRQEGAERAPGRQASGLADRYQERRRKAPGSGIADGALVVPGAPVSVLIDHGLTEAMVEKLMAGGVTPSKVLGSMTPEDLEALPGIDPEMVEAIQTAVNGYYGQFESRSKAGCPKRSDESAAVPVAPAAEAR